MPTPEIYGPDTVVAALQAATPTQRTRLAEALCLWLDERGFCHTPGERAINRVVTDMVERYEVEIERLEVEK